jgi:hypothetical protein
MTKTFTQNDVLRFYYNEVTETEKTEIENAILMNDSLGDFYYELIEADASLNKIKKEPSDKCIENILNYSKSFSLQSV